MSDKLKDMTPEEMLDMFKTPEKVNAQGKCTFVRKIEELPDNVRQAVVMACENKDVTNREILAFINSKTDVQVNLTQVQKHRHADGCIECMYGTATT